MLVQHTCSYYFDRFKLPICADLPKPKFTEMMFMLAKSNKKNKNYEISMFWQCLLNCSKIRKIAKNFCQRGEKVPAII